MPEPEAGLRSGSVVRRPGRVWRVFVSAGALAMIGTSAAIVLLTVVPTEPDELSACLRAGETRSRKGTAPSAPGTGALRAGFLI